MTAAEHERAGSVEGVEQRHARAPPPRRCGGRQAEQQQTKARARHARPAREMGIAPIRRRCRDRCTRRQSQSPMSPPATIDGDLPADRRGMLSKMRSAASGDTTPGRDQGTSVARHAPDRLRHDRDGDDFNPWIRPCRPGRRKPPIPVARKHQRIADGSVKAPHAASPPAGRRAAGRAHSRPGWTQGRAGTGTAPRDRIARFVKPLRRTYHELVPEIAEMGNRAAERCEAEFQEGAEHLACGPGCSRPGCLAWHVRARGGRRTHRRDRKRVSLPARRNRTASTDHRPAPTISRNRRPRNMVRSARDSCCALQNPRRLMSAPR